MSVDDQSMRARVRTTYETVALKINWEPLFAWKNFPSHVARRGAFADGILGLPACARFVTLTNSWSLNS